MFEMMWRKNNSWSEKNAPIIANIMFSCLGRAMVAQSCRYQQQPQGVTVHSAIASATTSIASVVNQNIVVMRQNSGRGKYRMQMHKDECSTCHLHLAIACSRGHYIYWSRPPTLSRTTMMQINEGEYTNCQLNYCKVLSSCKGLYTSPLEWR